MENIENIENREQFEFFDGTVLTHGSDGNGTYRYKDDTEGEKTLNVKVETSGDKKNIL